MIGISTLGHNKFPDSNSIVYKLLGLRAGNPAGMHLAATFGFRKFRTTREHTRYSLVNYGLKSTCGSPMVKKIFQRPNSQIDISNKSNDR